MAIYFSIEKLLNQFAKMMNRSTKGQQQQRGQQGQKRTSIRRFHFIMSKKICCLSVLLFWICGSHLLYAKPNSQLENVSVKTESRKTESSLSYIQISCSGQLSYTEFYLSQPRLRLVFDFHNMEINPKMALRWVNDDPDSTVAGYRFAKATQGELRLLIDLNKPAFVMPSDTAKKSSSCNRKFDLQPTTAVEFLDRSGFPANYVNGKFADQLLQSAAKENAVLGPPKILIDAGHGGKDPGTIGGKGTVEKDVTLIAALALESELQQMGYSVHLTRRNDQFLTLIERVEMARKIDADLFISLHADAGASKLLRGASVYTLDKNKDARAVRTSRNYDWDIDIPENVPDSVSSILEDLAKRNTRTASDKLAERIIHKLAEVGPVLNRSHRRAGFVVLFAPDVPAVLLEMGFLSNSQDEKTLMSLKKIKKNMRNVAAAIDDYFVTNDRSPVQ